MNHVILLKARDGEVATLSEFADDAVPAQTLLAGELLLHLGPYAPLIGKGKWVGSRVMALPLRGVAIPPAWREDDPVGVTHVVTRETENYLAEKFEDFHAVCNFSRGQYLLSPKPYSDWLGDPAGPGQLLLRLLITNTMLNWSGCEIAVTPVVLPWMRNITATATRLMREEQQPARRPATPPPVIKSMREQRAEPPTPKPRP